MFQGSYGDHERYCRRSLFTMRDNDNKGIIWRTHYSPPSTRGHHPIQRILIDFCAQLHSARGKRKHSGKIEVFGRNRIIFLGFAQKLGFVSH